MEEKKTIKDLEGLKGKTILVRCDFNVPIQNGEIQDDTKIREAIPTIQYLIGKGSKVILCSHLGQPDPIEIEQEEIKKKFSLHPVIEDLSNKLGLEVKFAGDLTGDSSHNMIEQLQEGEVGLLENTRFDTRETQNDKTLSVELANLADIYVNDAFATAHREHSSTEGVAKVMEEQGKETAIGLSMQKEIENLGAILENPKQPFIAILGGAKVSDKIDIIDNLIEKVDKILIGGKMANTFLKAKGYNIGSSSYEEDKIEVAKEIMKKAFNKGVEIVLPTDVHVIKLSEVDKLTPKIAENAEHKVVKLKDDIPNEYTIVDIGPNTLEEFAYVAKDSKTIMSNGPLGYVEAPKFAEGTRKLFSYIAKMTDAKCVIGGGDSIATVNRIIEDARENGEDMSKFNNFYLSTGGGASLKFLAGKELPGFKAIQNRERNKENKNSPTKLSCEQIEQTEFKQI